MSAATASADAWYVYGLRAEAGAAPVAEAILPDSDVAVLPVGRFAVLASRVPRPLFDRLDPANRTADPDWMGARVRAYHAVNAAAAEAAEAFLPLAFGTLFSSLDLLGDWLAPREAALRAALARVAGRTNGGWRWSRTPPCTPPGSTTTTRRCARWPAPSPPPARAPRSC